MELHQLECFLELSKFQNVSLTAEKLNISQPALSKTISLLENELGIQLFNRIGRRIYINEHGKAFARYVEESLKGLHLGVENVRKLEYQPAGTLSLGLFSYIGLISDCLHAFLETYPTIKLEAYSSKSQYTIENFNNIDFVLTSSLRTRMPNKKTYLESTPIATEQYVIVAAPELLHQYGNFPENLLPLSELHQLPFIVMAHNLMFSDITYTFCQRAGFTPNIILQTNDFATKLHMAINGTGAAFIPEVCIPIFKRQRPDFRFLYFSDLDTQRTIYLSRKKASEASHIAQIFWDFVLDYYQKKNSPMP